ncbi:MAG: DUF2948 family protein [Cypionkella sp.]|jgi:hypothetical protein
MSDARFEDGAEQPLRLMAQDGEGLGILSALVQDAVFPITEMTYAKGRRRFALLINRFRWEDRAAAEATARRYERVQSLLVFESVLSVKSSGIDRGDKDTVLSLLGLDWAESSEGAGVLTLVLAGDGAIALEVEAIDASLRDTTRPYLAPSGKVPDHKD